MGLFSAFKRKHTYTLYKDYTKANFETEYLFYTSGPTKLVLNYVRLGIFDNPYDGIGDKFRERSNTQQIQESSDLFALIRIANEFNNIEREKVKAELYEFFGKDFTLDDLTDICDHPDHTMFDDFKNTIRNHNIMN